MRRVIMAQALVVAALCSPAAAAQEADTVAQSTVGRAGQRQARSQPTISAQPMERINSRIRNRVQSRVRNRLDRFYSPQANTASPFEIAGEQTRTSGRPPTR
jgi:hypothetical protein